MRALCTGAQVYNINVEYRVQFMMNDSSQDFIVSQF